MEGETSLQLYQASTRNERVGIDLAVAAWLHAKRQKSQSLKTLTQYRAILEGFRVQLRTQGLDLDAADPRQLRAELMRDVARHNALHVTGGDSIGDAPDANVEEMTAHRAAMIALVAQAYAARPAARRGADPGHPVAASTANIRLAAISSFYHYALRYDLLRGVNPISRVERRPVQAYSGAHPLDYGDVRDRLASIDRSSSSGMRDVALLLVGLYTGRRLSELAGMRLEHLVIKRQAIEVEWPRCKGNKHMTDVLPRGGAAGAAADALATWVDHLRATPGAELHRYAVSQCVNVSGGSASSQPVWISLARNGTFGHPLSLRAIADICARHLGTSKVHALRHTFAHALEESGAKVSDIQAFLGHEDLSTTGRYLARLHRSENEHLGRLGALFGLAQPDDGGTV